MGQELGFQAAEACDQGPQGERGQQAGQAGEAGEAAWQGVDIHQQESGGGYQEVLSLQTNQRNLKLV